MSRSSSVRPPRLLLVDAGNSRTKLGLFERPTAAGELPDCVAAEAIENGSLPDWVAWSAQHRLATRPRRGGTAWRLCLAGSNPARIDELRASLPADWPEPLELPPRDRLPLVIDVDFPERVGIDRLLHAIAANALRRPEQAAVIVSSGTATTVDYVDAAGRFRGGAILPGFALAARALHQYTALLPLVPLEPSLVSPPDEVGRNTEAAIRSGLYWGHVGGVRELVRRLLHRCTVDSAAAGASTGRHLGNLSLDETPLLLVTGGAAPLLLPHLPDFHRHEPHLPLQGLALVVWRSLESPRG